MNMTAAENQRRIDEAGDIEDRAEWWQQDGRDSLTALQRFEYPDLDYRGRLTEDYLTETEVMEEIHTTSRDEVTLAFSLLDKNPAEAVRILREARDKAVSELLGTIDFERVARADFEQAKRDRRDAA